LNSKTTFSKLETKLPVVLTQKADTWGTHSQFKHLKAPLQLEACYKSRRKYAGLKDRRIKVKRTRSQCT